MNAPRVAVYLDFDNIVISRYEQVHPDIRDAWRADSARSHTPDPAGSNPVQVRLAEATVDIGAILDYASSFGTVALARAYADWSVPANAAYRRQLVDRAVDLTQLFPVSGTKNGADIRLAVDAIEHLVQYADITHVVIVGGDSDYIALAQRCKQLGRFVVGIGVTGSTSRALIAACDEFSQYDALPGVSPVKPRAAAKKTAAKTAKKAEQKATTRRSAKSSEVDPFQEATDLLVRAIRIAQDKADDGEWLNGGGLKSQMQRMDPSFKEQSLGFKTFSDFVESLGELVETRTDAPDGHLRLRLR
ncbi:NYN domain-containing protein [Jiangella asiatica]|uniref:NYN domain-containing protein n=1 Tax=Jiangella asiatica TaxID=2530372 RepID=A0A4R5CN56_9ACTN|nr:NYN domain-containing protein [Jiangella asiatica]TDE00700.1 NYN domain-containing protein [Jiangella asiatica]